MLAMVVNLLEANVMYVRHGAGL